MAKVTFEFNDEEENHDISLVVNRHKLICALADLQELYRKIYNGKLYGDEVISVKDNKVLTEEDYEKFRNMGAEYYPVKGTKQYLDGEYIENELAHILDDVRNLLDY